MKILGRIVIGLLLICCCGSVIVTTLFGPEGITGAEARQARGEPVGVDDWVQYLGDGGQTTARATVRGAKPGLGEYPLGGFADDTEQYRLELHILGAYDAILPGQNPDGGGSSEQGSYQSTGGTLTLTPRYPEGQPARTYQVESLTIDYVPPGSPDAGARVDGLRLRDGPNELVLHRRR